MQHTSVGKKSFRLLPKWHTEASGCVANVFFAYQYTSTSSQRYVAAFDEMQRTIAADALRMEETRATLNQEKWNDFALKNEQLEQVRQKIRSANEQSPSSRVDSPPRDSLPSNGSSPTNGNAALSHNAAESTSDLSGFEVDPEYAVEDDGMQSQHDELDLSGVFSPGDSGDRSRKKETKQDALTRAKNDLQNLKVIESLLQREIQAIQDELQVSSSLSDARVQLIRLLNIDHLTRMEDEAKQLIRFLGAKSFEDVQEQVARNYFVDTFGRALHALKVSAHQGVLRKHLGQTFAELTADEKRLFFYFGLRIAIRKQEYDKLALTGFTRSLFPSCLEDVQQFLSRHLAG
jgi:hypothetical protein